MCGARAIALASLLSLAMVVAAQSPANRYDVLIRNGTVIDGTGAPRYRADVAIAVGSIARVANLAGARAELEIYASRRNQDSARLPAWRKRSRSASARGWHP